MYGQTASQRSGQPAGPPQPSGRLGSLAAALVLTALLAAPAISPPVAAADPARVVSETYAVSIAPPEGWKIEEPTPGAVVAFEPADGSPGRIELRASPRVPGSLKAAYLGAFRHTVGSAYDLDGEPSTSRYGLLEGTEMIFDSRRAGGGPRERMVAFAFFRRDMAYILVAYIPAGRWDALYPAFQAAIGTIGFQ